MDYYQKINKNPPQGSGGGGGGGLSPAKLRSMLKKIKKQGEDETNFSLGSQVSDSGDSLENYRDVDVVSVLPERVTSATAVSRIGSQDDGYLDYESGIDKIGAIATPFEFQKAERASHRKPVAPFSKPAPSKWDDAQKWIASPTSNRPKNEQPLKKNSHGNRQPITKVVVEVPPDQSLVVYEEADTKQIDLSHSKENEGRYASWGSDHPIPSTTADSYSKSVVMIEDCVGDSAINLSRHDSSLSIQNATYVPPPSAARSVSMRDMGTEMTPIASQEPSRTGTPVRATTPSRSPNSSRPTTPERTAASVSSTAHPPNSRLESGSSKELSEKELQLKTRREIQALGTQLGKMNIAAWASKEEEDKDASSSMKTLGAEKEARSAIEMRAAAWEDAEKAKYTARFKREEVKIEAWENHQKAKTEAEMRRIEVEVERMRGGAHDRLMNKLAAARHKAEEKRAAAEAKRNRQAAKAEEQAEYIRKTGRIPSSFACYRCSSCCF